MISKLRNRKAIAFLKALAGQRRGLLEPAHVVLAAKPRTSPIHQYFTWKDGEAARQWRLHEARNLLRVSVEVIGGQSEPSRVFVSLEGDRGKGGYRQLVQVLSDAELRAQLLREAAEDMELFTTKFKRLRELSDVLKAMRRARKRLRSVA